MTFHICADTLSAVTGIEPTPKRHDASGSVLNSVWDDAQLVGGRLKI